MVIPKAGRAFRPALCTAALSFAAMMTGCTPGFFHATGSVSSDGGGLRAWSETPISCNQYKDMGDPNTLAEFLFDIPPGFQPTNPGHRNVPLRLTMVRNGPGVMGRLEMIEDIQGATDAPHGRSDSVVLDNSNCTRIALDLQQQFDPGEKRKPAKGRLQLACSVDGSHLSADVQFKGCFY